MKIRMLSSNANKIAEAQKILTGSGIELVPEQLKITELQIDDGEILIHQKALSAYKEVMRPLFVEHTGLEIRYINGLPGGLTQIFWDTLQAEKFAELFGRTADPSAKATTRIGYCDGKNIHVFIGQVEGKIANEPRGSRAFQWDCVFIPDGCSQTFSELGDKKNEISMRRKALDQFAKYVEGRS